MIGVFGSDVTDVKLLLEKATINCVKKFCQATFYETDLEDKKVLIVTTGYNKVNIGIAAGHGLKSYDIDVILGVGNCGALDTWSTRIGDVAIAESSVQYSVNSTALGYPDTVIPGLEKGVFHCDKRLVKLAKDTACDMSLWCNVGRVATAEEFLDNPQGREFIKSKYNSMFIDMECGNLGEIAYLSKTPSVFVKCVSNGAGYCAAEEFNKYSSQANKRSNEVVCKMIKRMRK